MPRDAANEKLTEAGSFFRRAASSFVEETGEPALTTIIGYSRIRMLSGVESRKLSLPAPGAWLVSMVEEKVAM